MLLPDPVFILRQVERMKVVVGELEQGLNRSNNPFATLYRTAQIGHVLFVVS